MGSHWSRTEPLRGRVTTAVAKETESSAAEMNQSRIEESHSLRELVPANPVCFVKETVPMGQRKWIDTPAGKWHQEDALSTEISKLVMRMGRHSDQDEREVEDAVHWDSMRRRLRNTFLIYRSSEFSDLDWVTMLHEFQRKIFYCAFVPFKDTQVEN